MNKIKMKIVIVLEASMTNGLEGGRQISIYLGWKISR